MEAVLSAPYKAAPPFAQLTGSDEIPKPNSAERHQDNAHLEIASQQEM
jgi:hypothetical protein